MPVNHPMSQYCCQPFVLFFNLCVLTLPFTKKSVNTSSMLLTQYLIGEAFLMPHITKSCFKKIALPSGFNYFVKQEIIGIATIS